MDSTATPIPTVPSSNRNTTCRRAQMSRWRQKGFVQDSDDEEETQIESQNSNRHADLSERVERDGKFEEAGILSDGGRDDEEKAAGPGARELGTSKELTTQIEQHGTPTKHMSLHRPTPSPFTPILTLDTERERTESPDPLQSLASPKIRRIATIESSQLLGSPIFREQITPLAIQHDNAASSQLLGEPLVTAHLASRKETSHVYVDVLGEFGIAPLSDDSDGDALSDPPSDLESPPTHVAFAEPHRRTAVRVVIPSSTALQRHLAEQESRREFRQRKPIQLHPYLLEGEQYRREVQSRGLKPVARVRSPQRQFAGENGESQEKEFDPNMIPSSSPPEQEIHVSIPVAARRVQSGQKISRRLSASDAPQHRPSAQLRLSRPAKRRRLNLSLTQPIAKATQVEDDEPPLPPNIWDIPTNSPPYSSSPPLSGHSARRRTDHPRLVTPVPDLLTPSTSSVFQDDVRPLQDEDSDPVPRSTLASGGGLRMPARVVLDDTSSSESEASVEPEDNELRTAGRKIKGVLPASWLRFDKQTQDRRKAEERDRERLRVSTVASPEWSERQKGVAQRISRPAGRPPGSMSSVLPLDNVLIISDDSDDGNVPLQVQQQVVVQESADSASALAAMFDDRYAEDNLSDMEHDRLHLPTLGGGGAKQKRQPKITDALGGAKRMKQFNGVAGASAITKHLFSSNRPRKTTKQQSRLLRRTPPSSMSVVDIDISPARHNGNVPQFLKVARRQALRRPDLARQSPDTKQIRLYNARDTEDANLALRNWREGVLKPRATAAIGRHAARQPPAHTSENRQAVHTQSTLNINSEKSLEKRPEPGSDTPRIRRRKPMPHGLAIFTRNPTAQSQFSQYDGKTSTKVPKKPRALPDIFRTAQLEGDEKEFSSDYRKIAFEKGLQRADRQFDLPSTQQRAHMNPQLARFLADDDIVLPLLPTAASIGEHDATSPGKQQQAPKKRLTCKRLAQRIDVDTREYRQPSEPAIEEVFGAVGSKQDQAVEQEDNSLILYGLGPHGTRYPVTFESFLLGSDTYFHSSTFIGSDEFRRALATGIPGGRNLDEPAGYCNFARGALNARLGPWGDETSSQIQVLARHVFAPFDTHTSISEVDLQSYGDALDHSTYFLRTLILYVSDHVSFLDPIDRRSFVERMAELTQSMFDSVMKVRDAISLRNFPQQDEWSRKSMRIITYLLVSVLQIYQLATHPLISTHDQLSTTSLIKSVSNTLLAQLVRQGVAELSGFIEGNKRHAVRQGGVQDSDLAVECTVICMHVLERAKIPKHGFWDSLGAELSPKVIKTYHVASMEATWATIYTFLPFAEIDVSGIPSRNRQGMQAENWTTIRDLLKRLYELYPATSRRHGTSINEYIRTSLARCHRLMKYWRWERPEQMLNATFDFFRQNKMQQLRHEANKGSVSFLDHLAAEQPLTLEPNEAAFHIALKCLALGLQGMRQSCTQKKIASFVVRIMPQHDRGYPKDESLDEVSLAALRNHYDLLAVLYWAAPAPCRPKLDVLRRPVNHESSHREACRLSVRFWANLATFQLSTEEPYVAVEPFALEFKAIMHQNLLQYRLAKTEADEYIKMSGTRGSTTDVSAVMVRQTMERNQEQVIATLRDCVAGIRKAIKTAKDPASLAAFLADSDIVHLLELPHLADRRLISVIKDALATFRDYAALQKAPLIDKESQATSEESQDYGDFPDLDDFDDEMPHINTEAVGQSGLDFVQTPLWHLLSNAFGADRTPDDDLLMDCVGTWVSVARAQVLSGRRTWSHYIGSYSLASWAQLRQTEQTRKFGPYYLAALIDSDLNVYGEHRHELIKAMLISLVERESMLRYQWRLLSAILRTDHHHPLLQNLPYFRTQDTGDFDVSAETLRTRRLALISSILSNMRDDMLATTRGDPANAPQMKRTYATMLQDFMTAMQTNYQQLQQGANVTGAYVEFVQKVVKFLTQYTNDIFPVPTFFTDNAAFPLPAGDPKYVVARLCGYAPKLSESGTATSLSMFIQTVAQQAAADNLQSYLVNQLVTALCTDEAPSTDRQALRHALLQGVFPVYLEQAFSSITGFLIARPILRALPTILDSLLFDLRITQPASVSSTIATIIAVSHAFIRGMEGTKDNPYIFRQPHILATLSYMMESMIAITPMLDYICGRLATSATSVKPNVVTHMEEMSTFITEMLQDTLPSNISVYDGDANAPSTDRAVNNLLGICSSGLKESLRRNWSENQGTIWFGYGQPRREVVYDLGLVEEERSRLEHSMAAFQRMLRGVYGEECTSVEHDGGLVDGLVV